jgi:hypothetical protein
LVKWVIDASSSRNVLKNTLAFGAGVVVVILRVDIVIDGMT